MNLAQLTAMPPDEAEFYLRRRSLRDRGSMFSEHRCWGISSDALVDYAFRLRREPAEWDYPHDPSDLAACQRSYEMAPPRLQALMDPVMAKYRAHVERRYPQATARVAHYLRTGQDLPAGHPDLPPLTALEPKP